MALQFWSWTLPSGSRSDCLYPIWGITAIHLSTMICLRSGFAVEEYICRLGLSKKTILTGTSN